MTDRDRITMLEQRVAELQRRVAELKGGPVPGLPAPQVYRTPDTLLNPPWQITCAPAGSWRSSGG